MNKMYDSRVVAARIEKIKVIDTGNDNGTETQTEGAKSTGVDVLSWRMALCEKEYRMAAWIAMALGFFQ